MNNYILDSRLEADTLALANLELCEVRLFKSSDNPWLVLIPRRSAVVEVSDLSVREQTLLWQEVIAMSNLIQKHFAPTKMNLATLGNVVSQLHFHVIGRFKTDPHWPAPVWGKTISAHAAQIENYRQQLAHALNQA